MGFWGWLRDALESGWNWLRSWFWWERKQTEETKRVDIWEAAERYRTQIATDRARTEELIYNVDPVTALKNIEHAKEERWLSREQSAFSSRVQASIRETLGEQRPGMIDALRENLNRLKEWVTGLPNRIMKSVAELIAKAMADHLAEHFDLVIDAGFEYMDKELETYQEAEGIR